MREVSRSAVAELNAKGIPEPGVVGQWGSPVVRHVLPDPGEARRAREREVMRALMGQGDLLRGDRPGQPFG